MIRAVLRYLLGGIPAPPPLGPYLLTALGMLVNSGLNLLFVGELWPNTPVMKQALPLTTSLAALATGPQLLWWGWRWLRAYTGPSWLRKIVSMVYLCGVLLGLLLGLLGLIGYVLTG